MREFQPRGVLGGNYRGGRKSLEVTRVHLLEVTGGEEAAKTLCGRVKAENLADEYARTGPVNCPLCLERFHRLEMKSR